jgi:glutaredoxin 3
MATVVMYTTAYCPYCDRAKELLTQKNVAFKEIRVDQDEKQKQLMMELSGRRTVPQIFINDQSIGGFDDLHALDVSGKLDDLLK